VYAGYYATLVKDVLCPRLDVVCKYVAVGMMSCASNLRVLWIYGEGVHSA
jgi:hypothetical protein